MRQSCVTPILAHQPAAIDEETESLKTAHSSVKLKRRFKTDVTSSVQMRRRMQMLVEQMSEEH
jgi:hypothetical protein